MSADGLDRIPLEYFGRAIDWVADQPEVDGERVGAVRLGFFQHFCPKTVLLLGGGSADHFDAGPSPVVGQFESEAYLVGFGRDAVAK